MKATLLRAAVVGGLVVTITAPFAGSAQATCGPVLIEACRIVCTVGRDIKPVYTLCTIT